MGEGSNMNGKDFVIGALLGGIIGACAALLLAPKSGRELRGDLNEGYHTVAKKTQDIAKNVGEQTGSIVSKVKEVASTVKEDLSKLRTSDNLNHEESMVEDKNAVMETARQLTEEAATALDKAKAVSEAEQN